MKAKHLMSNQMFNLANDCRIVIDGNSEGRLSDLRIGQKVAIDYREVDGVYVATRISPAQNSGESAEAHVTRVAK